MEEDRRQPPPSLADLQTGIAQVEKVKRPTARDQLAKAEEDLKTKQLENDTLQVQIESFRSNINM